MRAALRTLAGRSWTLGAPVTRQQPASSSVGGALQRCGALPLSTARLNGEGVSAPRRMQLAEPLNSWVRHLGSAKSVPATRRYSTGAATSAQPAIEAPSASHALAAAEDAPLLAVEIPTHARFVNMIMRSGKKQTAQRLLLHSFSRLQDEGYDPHEVFRMALKNVTPMVEMRTVRAGAIPFPLNPRRAEGQGMKWIVDAARKRGRASFDRNLALELIAASQDKGNAVRKREEVHRMAVANQAAAHFRWRTSSASLPGSVDMERRQNRPQGRRAIKRLQGGMS